MLKRMFMSTLQKIGVAFVFSLVLLSTVFDILRTVYTAALRPDFQDESTVWALLELTIAVIVCALAGYGSCLCPRREKTSRSPISSLFSTWPNKSSESISMKILGKDSQLA